MSRRATNEYIGMKRRAYQAASRPKRREILAEVCTNTGYSKDYATRLLSGSRKFRERKDRGKKFGSVQRNRRSGVSNSLKNAIECKSGKEIMACCVKPGDMQVDTFALCGGSMADNFYWILTATDRRTQWTRISPAWNRGEATTLGAPGRIAAHIPFEVLPLQRQRPRRGEEPARGAGTLRSQTMPPQCRGFKAEKHWTAFDE